MMLPPCIYPLFEKHLLWKKHKVKVIPVCFDSILRVLKYIFDDYMDNNVNRIYVIDRVIMTLNIHIHLMTIRQ